MAGYSPYNAMTGASTGNQGAMGGAISGMASGASAGAAIGSVIPGVGTVVGAAVGGVVGAVSGFFGGKKKDKSEYYQKLASQVQRQREFNQLYTQQLQHVRGVRQARAESVLASALSGVQGGSLASGATSSIGSQSAYSLQTVGEDVRLQEQQNEYLRKANKLLNTANNIQQWSSMLMSGLASFSSAYSAGQQQLEAQQARQAEQQLAQVNKAFSAQEGIYSAMTRYLNTLPADNKGALNLKFGEQSYSFASLQQAKQEVAKKRLGLQIQKAQYLY